MTLQKAIYVPINRTQVCTPADFNIWVRHFLRLIGHESTSPTHNHPLQLQLPERTVWEEPYHLRFLLHVQPVLDGQGVDIQEVGFELHEDSTVEVTATGRNEDDLSRFLQAVAAHALAVTGA
jgi:hypothetical protein